MVYLETLILKIKIKMMTVFFVSTFLFRKDKNVVFQFDSNLNVFHENQ